MNSKNAIYKKRRIIRGISIMLTMKIFINCFVTPVFANDMNPFNRNYPIRQKQSSEGGVLISKPQSLDKDVFQAIRLHQIKTLEAYSQWLDTRMTYKKDGVFDNWSHPDETWEKKTGDCEDYAILNLTVLSKLGFEVRFMALFRNKAAHAICVVKQNGTYSWFDNAKFNKTEAKTLEELGEIITDEYVYSSVGEYNASTETWDTVYKKS